MSKVLIAMSGGVDSSVTLALLKSRGFEVIGATMLINDHMNKAISDAQIVAKTLGVEHIVLDYREIFIKEIENYFIDSYLNGITPNPCVKCNKLIKFGKLLEDAKTLGCQYIATGHYIRVEKDKKIKKYILKNSAAQSKDQTYFLYKLDQEQLSCLITPLADLSKEKVRQIGRDLGLHVADKSDSQEICFIEDDDYKRYIFQNLKHKQIEGNFVDAQGKILGKHMGITNYTIGQRKGLNISLGKPVYVISIDVLNNEVILGDRQDCYGKEMIIDEINLMYLNRIKDGMKVSCKIRSGMRAEYATIFNLVNNRIKVVFDKPVWAPTPGQSAVFYDRYSVVGGGIIKEVQLSK